MEIEKNLNQLSASVRKQREIAQGALDEAKKVDELLKAVDLDPRTKETLEKIKAGILKVTRELVANTASTSAVVASTLSSIGEITKNGRD